MCNKNELTNIGLPCQYQNEFVFHFLVLLPFLLPKERKQMFLVCNKESGNKIV